VISAINAFTFTGMRNKQVKPKPDEFAARCTFGIIVDARVNRRKLCTSAGSRGKQLLSRINPDNLQQVLLLREHVAVASTDI